jgi:hypothetical protein
MIIVGIMMRQRGIQPFRHLGMPHKLTRTETLKRDIEEKPKANEGKEEPAINSSEASSTTPEKVHKKKHSPKRSSESSSKHSTNSSGASSTKHSPKKETTLPLYTASTHWDLFSTKEDTMRLYGVSQEHLDKLVEQYKTEQKYEIETAPTTLTFNLDKWEQATDSMQDSMRNITVQTKPYEFGLVDSLYKEGEY